MMSAVVMRRRRGPTDPYGNGTLSEGRSRSWRRVMGGSRPNVHSKTRRARRIPPYALTEASLCQGELCGSVRSRGHDPAAIQGLQVVGL